MLPQSSCLLHTADFAEASAGDYWGNSTIQAISVTGIELQHIHHKRKCLSCLKCARNLHVRYITTVDSPLHYQGTRWTSSLSHLIPYMSEPIPSLSHSTPYLSELIPRLSHLILGLSESVLRLSHFIPSLSYSIPVLSESVPRLSHSIPRLSELNPWLSCSFPDQSDYIPNLSEKSTWKRNQFIIWDVGRICK